MANAVCIRSMDEGDLDFAARCTAGEGWASETRAEFEAFRAHDPQGCIVAEAAGTRVGIAVATHYGACGFVGLLIVLSEWRGRGIGRRLLEHAVAYLCRRGARDVYLDAVPAAIPLYERVGFRVVCRSLRFSGLLAGGRYPDVRPMRAGDLPTVLRMDSEAFGADRGFFLARRLALYPELCKVLESGGRTVSFVLGRRGHDLVSAGPWLVEPGVEWPERLLRAIAAEAGTMKLGVGVLETNKAAVSLQRALGLAESPTPSWRMVLGPGGAVGDSPRLYGIGSAAKG